MSDKTTGRSYVQLYADSLRKAAKELDEAELAVFMYLLSYADDRGVCFPGIKLIAEGTGIRIAAVGDVLHGLAAAGYVLYVRKDSHDPLTKRQLPNIYQISLAHIAINTEHVSEAMQIQENALKLTYYIMNDSKLSRNSGIITTDRNHLQDTPTRNTPTGTTQRDTTIVDTTDSASGSADALTDGYAVETPNGSKHETAEHRASETDHAARSQATTQVPPEPGENPEGDTDAAPQTYGSMRWPKPPPTAGYAAPLEDSTQESLSKQIYEVVQNYAHGAEAKTTALYRCRCLVYNYPDESARALKRFVRMSNARPDYQVENPMGLLTTWARQSAAAHQAVADTVAAPESLSGIYAEFFER